MFVTLGYANISQKPKAQAIEEKINKLDFIKIKAPGLQKTCKKKQTKRMKKCKKIFANRTHDKELVSRMKKSQ